ncbi:MAG: ABC transporter permease [Deltaproteobacteria bacterium]|nr:ABC transporter permease [Deltaproteobacteria bacterium]
MARRGNSKHMLGDALGSVKENALTTVVTSVTVGFSLAILALFLFVFINLDAAAAAWGDRTHVVVYIKDAALDDAGAVARIKAKTLEVPGVKAVEYISKERALAELKDAMKGHEAVLAGVDAGALPASLEVRLGADYMEGFKAAVVVERFKVMDWAEEVQYSHEWVEKFSAFLRFFEAAALGAGVFLAGATVFIISNTIRLTVYARRDEIEIMRLVGATNGYIRLPFFLEGVLQGLIGGALAVFIIYSGRWLLLTQMPAYLVFVVEVPAAWYAVLGATVAAGVILGAAGSIVSTARFMKR